MLPFAPLTGLCLVGPAHANRIDLNAAPPDELRRIVLIDENRARQVIDGRPWPDIRALTGVPCIGPARVAEIEDQGPACVGYRAPAGEREVIRGRAVVLDADGFEVAGNRVGSIR